MKFLHIIALVFALLVGNVVHAETALPQPESLPIAAQNAKALGEPLLLLVSLPGCTWCELMRRNYLLPMRKEGLQAYQIERYDEKSSIIGWWGKATTPALISQSYAIKITPTLLFLDAKGNEIASRMEGVTSVDFLSAYLNQGIEKARKAVLAQNKVEGVK